MTAENGTDFNTTPAPGAPVIVAGATGDLGLRIVRHLRARGAEVKVLVRQSSTGPAISALNNLGVTVAKVDFNSLTNLTHACTGGACLVSAVNGLRDVIIDLQTRLLQAALAGSVPRFIPSDYCIDYTKLSYGANRNLALRMEFSEQLNQSTIKATSILNGMFTDLLTGEAPVVLFKIKRVLYWGYAGQQLDFTSIENTAAYTAAAALDSEAPRFLRIAGEVATIRDLQQAATLATGQEFKLLRAGSLGLLQGIIKITRTLFPQPQEIFPPWQGMQYLHNMLSGLPKLNPLDNNRYKEITWTPIREVLAARKLN